MSAFRMAHAVRQSMSPDIAPRGRTAVVNALQVLLVLAGIHRLPEPIVQVGVKHFSLSQRGKNVNFEILSIPKVEHPFIEHKEAGVDPLLRDERLFNKTAHP